MITRRSWTAPIPWWPLALLTSTSAIAATLITTMAVGNDPRENLPLVLAVTALAASAGAALNARHRNHARQELREQAAHHGDDPYAAELVARTGAPPTSPSERQLALAIIDLRWREGGGYAMPMVMAATALVLVFLAVTSSWWWGVLAVVAASAAAGSFWISRALARRRDQLTPSCASPPAAPTLSRRERDQAAADPSAVALPGADRSATRSGTLPHAT